MAEPSPFTAREVAFLRALVDEGVAFLVVGMAAAALQGAPAVTQDVDLWFANLNDPKLKKALARAGAAYVPPTASTPPLLAGGGADLFDIVMHMDGLMSFHEEAKAAIRLAVGNVLVPVLPLDRIIASKRRAGRPKDKAILPVLEDTLGVLRRRKRP